MKMEQLINNLANTFKDEELIECYKTRKELNEEQGKHIKLLEDRLKERNDYIHNLKWEHSNQLDKLKKEIDRLNNEIIWEWNEKVIGLKETITELKEEINQLKTLLGEPFVPY